MKYRKMGRYIERIPETDAEFYHAWGSTGLTITGRVAKQIVDVRKRQELKRKEKKASGDEEA